MPKKWELNTKEKEECLCLHCKRLASRPFVEYTWPPLGEAEMHKLKISVPRGFPIASPFSRETQE